MSGQPCPHGHLHIADGDPVVRKLGLGVPALQFQQLGYPVFPLGRLSKRPHKMLGPSGGFKHASRRWSDVDRWWSQDRLAGVGVPTGMGSGLVVVDLDIKRGEDGRAQMSAFMEQNRLSWNGEPPIVATPSGGYHLWLRIPPITLPSRTSILPGVDIKADGGYVVVPPSMTEVVFAPHSGDRGGVARLPYRWVSGCPCSVPSAPQWLVDWVITTHGTGSGGGGRSGGGGAAWADGPPLDLAELVRTGLPVGQRNDLLYRLACQRYRSHGTGPGGHAAVMADVGAVLAATDCSGFGEAEIGTTVGWARRFIEGQEQREAELVSQAASWLGRSRI